MRRNRESFSTLSKTLGRSLAPVGLVLALLAAFAEALSGMGSRWGWWYYRTGLAIFGFGAIMGAVAAVVSLIGGILAGSQRAVYRMAAAGIVLGLVATGIPWSWSRTAKQAPRIHDVSTDMSNPPQFTAILPLRKDAENPAAYGGPDVAAKQSIAYPDLQPLILPLTPDAALDRAGKIAAEMGWNLVSIDGREGRIEATATTFWFGFKDDVVVRVAKTAEGSRIDVRSVSRVGVSDVGANAKRIRTFLEKMRGRGD